MARKDNLYYDITIDTGGDFELSFTLYGEGSTVVDLTGAIVRAQLREYPEGSVVTDFVCTHNDDGGQITISMVHEVTRDLGYTYGWFDVKVEYPDQTIEEVMHGKAFISANITRPQTDGIPYTVVAFESFDDFPSEGNSYRIYLDREYGQLYYWTGSQYLPLLYQLKGDAATIEVGDVVTGDPGTPVIVTNSGDQHHAVFDFTIPRGEQGVIYPTGNWDPTRAYTKLDMVYYEGSSYVAKENVPVGTPITDTTYWQITASKGDRGASGYSEIVTMEFDPENTYYTGECVIYENEVYRLLSDYMGTGGWEAVTAQKLAVQTHKANLDVIANEFDNTTFYPAGDHVIFAGNLYRFTVDHPAGAWDITQVERMTVEDGMDDLKDMIIDMHLTKQAPITDPEDDIPQGWKVLGNNFYIYDTEGQLSGQPSRYGMLYNIVAPSGTNVSQIWIMIPDGDLYVRAGNASGWGDGWIKLARDAYLSNYLPLAGGTMTGAIREQSGVIDLTQETPSSTQYYSPYGITDKNGDVITLLEAIRDTSGLLFTRISTKRIVNGNTYWNQLDLRLDENGAASYRVSGPAAFRDAINAVNKSGDTMTGGLNVKNWIQIVQDNVKIGTAPTSKIWGIPFCFADQDNAAVGHVRIVYQTSGMNQLYLDVNQKVGSETVQHYLALNVAADGTLSVDVSDKKAWLTGIGAAPASHTHSYLPLTGGTLTGSVIIKGDGSGSLALADIGNGTVGGLVNSATRIYLRAYNVSTGKKIDHYLPIPEQGQSDLTRYIPSMSTGTSAMTSGTSTLATNTLYLQYE